MSVAETAVRVDALDTHAALDRERELLERVSGDPGLRYLWLWEAPRSLVVPQRLARLPRFDAAAAALAQDGWPVAVRATGGDVTPQGPGIVNVTHTYACNEGHRFDLAGEYDRLCTPIERALGPGAERGWRAGAFCDGAYNVQWNGLKFAGTAMRFRQCRADRSRHAVMAHALMLMAPPETEAIAALNTLLEALGEPRRIDPAVHTGIPGGEARAGFLGRLVAEFRALPGLDSDPVAP